MKGRRLLDLDHKARTLANGGHLREATDALVELLDLQPDWEHGRGWYDLAGWYEDVGDIEKARQAYQQALTYSPHDSIFAGGYASFEYLHGDPQQAVELHLNLVRIERRMKSAAGYDGAVQGLRAAAARAGLEDADVEELLARLFNETGP